MSSGIVFSAGAAEKIKKATARILNSPPDLTGEPTRTTEGEESFWGLVTGISDDGNRYTFVRVYPTADNDSGKDFALRNGPSYRLAGIEPEGGLARESSGAKGVPTMSVVRMTFAGYDADDRPNFLFQFVGPSDLPHVPPHDHRDNKINSGGYAFAVYHPGTGLPAQPWAM